MATPSRPVAHLLALTATAALLAGSTPPAMAQQVVPSQTMRITATARVNFSDLARQGAAAQRAFGTPPVRVLIRDDDQNEMDGGPQSNLTPTPTPGAEELYRPPVGPFVASPSPTISFAGLGDIPMADSSYIIIPPDVGGAVGPDKVMEGFNNNYQVHDKLTGAVLMTVGTATFWNPVVANKALLNALTDPRTTYDPFNQRWLVAMQTISNPALILFGVSQTSDPTGAWFLYAVTPGFSSAPQLDFPILGFNKNWLVVTINAYNSGGSFRAGGTMIASYPAAMAGTLTSTTNVTQATGTHFCTAPCVTLSATEDTLFLVTSITPTSASYEVDRITGTSTSPTYTSGSAVVRPGGAYAAPSGQSLPQSAPISGSSACSPACKIEIQDANVRSAPMYRVDTTSGRGFVYFTQTVGLPSSGQTHSAVQWTKITPSSSPVFADGGRIEDPTATATNGGKWYAYPHIAVNAKGDFIIGYSQFSSTQYPSAGYSYHDHTDALGTLRDPLIYKSGEDYYHKTFGSGRNRWGDFSTAQVDPSDDTSLWVLQEYSKARINTDDGNTGSNGSRWASYWASLNPGAATFTITATAGANGSITPSGSVPVTQGSNQSFSISANTCYHIVDVQVDGSSVGQVTLYTFNNVQANHTISATFAIDVRTITASAGAHGTISPNGATPVNCGGNQTFTITPDACYHVADVLVDGLSVGAMTSVPFTNVLSDHTISASFAVNTYVIAAGADTGGAIAPTGSVSVNCGADQAFTITPHTGQHVSDVQVDGSSVGPVTSYSFTNVTAPHTIAASFGLDSFTVAVAVSGQGSVARLPDQDRYAYGQGVSLTATPAVGWGFTGWSGDVVSTTNPLPLTVTAAISLTASFADSTAPVVQVLAPAGGAEFAVGSTATLSWSATDNVAVTGVDLLLSRSGAGGPFDSLAIGIANSGSYSWTVTGPATTTAFLEVAAHDASGLTGVGVSDSAFTITSSTAVSGGIPADFGLVRIAPQPMRGTAHVRFAMPRAAAVRLSVFDIAGREVAVLADGTWGPGIHETTWRADNGPPGLYFVRMTVPGRTFVERMVRIR